MHDLFGMESPTDSMLVKNILEDAKRRLSKSVVKKEPGTPELLLKMFNSLYREKNVKNQRIICACLLAYAGFLRSEELLKIKRSDIVFHSTYINVFIESSKTGVYRDRAWVTVSRTGATLCPVVNLERYLTWAQIDSESEGYIFCCISKCKNGYKLRQK
jgi:integrase